MRCHGNGVRHQRRQSLPHVLLHFHGWHVGAVSITGAVCDALGHVAVLILARLGPKPMEDPRSAQFVDMTGCAPNGGRLYRTKAGTPGHHKQTRTGGLRVEGGRTRRPVEDDQAECDSRDDGRRQLREVDRNSLTYSFLPGDSLWDNRSCAEDVAQAAGAGAACQGLLDKSEKARMQWKLEERLQAFEREVADAS